MKVKNEKLGKHIQQIRGITYSSDESIKVATDGYVPVLRANNIVDGAIAFNNLVYVPQKRVNTKQLILEGDIIIAASSGSVDVVGKAAYSNFKWNGSFGAFCKVIRPHNSIDKKYLSFFFETNYYRKTISNVVNGSNIKNLRSEHIDELKIPVPDIQTQKRIADILEEANVLRKTDNQIVIKYEELAQSLFFQLFGDPIKNNKKWKKKKLKEVCEKITDGTHFSPPGLSEGVPYITAKHVKNYGLDFDNDPTYISEEEHKKIYARCSPNKGDILYIKDGATTGIAAINEYSFEFSMLSSLALLKPKKEVVNNYFLMSWLNNEAVKQKLILRGMAGAAIKRFTLTKIKEFEILVPPLDIQNYFANIISEIDAQKVIVAKQLKQSEALFHSLLQRAFKGEL